MNTSRLLRSLVVSVSACALFGCGGPDESLGSSEWAVSEDDARGAFTCDIRIAAGTDLAPIIGLFEVDRMNMADRPGFIVHRLPATLDVNGQVIGGIQMLFDTVENANAFSEWLKADYAPGGVLFGDRPIFESVQCRTWELVGRMEEPGARAAHVETRVERFRVEGQNAREQLRSWFRQVKAESKARGYSSAWLMYSEADQTASLVYYDDNHSQLGSHSAFASNTTFDLSAWVLSSWFPFRSGDHGEPSVWPNSPPFPAPGPGDGVCSVSRGESAENTTDCLPTCGNRVADPGEDGISCPGDVRLF